MVAWNDENGHLDGMFHEVSVLSVDVLRGTVYVKWLSGPVPA